MEVTVPIAAVMAPFLLVILAWGFASGWLAKDGAEIIAPFIIVSCLLFALALSLLTGMTSP